MFLACVAPSNRSAQQFDLRRLELPSDYAVEMMTKLREGDARARATCAHCGSCPSDSCGRDLRDEVLKDSARSVLREEWCRNLSRWVHQIKQILVIAGKVRRRTLTALQDYCHSVRRSGRCERSRFERYDAGKSTPGKMTLISAAHWQFYRETHRPSQLRQLPPT